MTNWVVTDYNPPAPQVIPALTAAKQSAIEAKIEELALKATFPSLAERIDGDRVEPLCPSLVQGAC